jgi:hypothetical protein
MYNPTACFDFFLRPGLALIISEMDSWSFNKEI